MLATVGVTPQQFKALQRRLERSRRVAPPVSAATGPARNTLRTGQVILGIDPSLRGTGYGVIRLARPHPVALAYGAIKCPADWLSSRCLAFIGRTLREIIRRHQPEVCVVEGLFYAQNLRTALRMGEARGAGLAVAAEAGLAIYEMAPRRVKQAIVGYGNAQKLAVAKMVQRLLRLAELPEADAADALALALAHVHTAGPLSQTFAKQI